MPLLMVGRMSDCWVISPSAARAALALEPDKGPPEGHSKASSQDGVKQGEEWEEEVGYAPTSWWCEE